MTSNTVTITSTPIMTVVVPTPDVDRLTPEEHAAIEVAAACAPSRYYGTIVACRDCDGAIELIETCVSYEANDGNGAVWHEVVCRIKHGAIFAGSLPVFVKRGRQLQRTRWGRAILWNCPIDPDNI